MKSLTPWLLIGAASAAVSPQQQVLQPPKQASDAWTRPLHSIQESLKTLTGEARAIWDEIAMLYPEDMAKANLLSLPKKHTRRPDSHWDHITKGEEVQNIRVENSDGERERDVDGKLDTYNLRSKKVDPSSLGVDPDIKQYSGYLDDEEHDKHLFYCKESDLVPDQRWLILIRVLRVSQRSEERPSRFVDQRRPRVLVFDGSVPRIRPSFN